MRTRRSLLLLTALALFTNFDVVGRAQADAGTYTIRFNNNGSIDTTYGFAGVTISNPQFTNCGHGIGVFPFFPNKIVTVGSFWTSLTSGTTGLIARTDDKGATDNTFGFMGVNVLDVSAASIEWIDEMGFQSSSKIIVAGGLFPAPGSLPSWIVARFNWNGSLDTTFGTNGFTTLFSGSDLIFDMVIDGSNRIVLVGHAPNGHWGIARRTQHGALDNSFGQNGTVKLTIVGAGRGEHADAVDIYEDKIVVAGSPLKSNTHISMVRLTSAGALDPTFGSGGKLDVDFPGLAGEHVSDIDCWPSGPNQGCVVVGGTGTTNPGGVFAVARIKPNGTIDTGFGLRTTSFAGLTSSAANEVIVTSDNKITVAGRVNLGGQHRIGLARYLSDGTLDGTFGSGGKVLQSIGTADINIQDMALDTSGGNRFLIIGDTN